MIAYIHLKYQLRKNETFQCNLVMLVATKGGYVSCINKHYVSHQSTELAYQNSEIF